jgi:hypothetical protein
MLYRDRWRLDLPGGLGAGFNLGDMLFQPLEILEGRGFEGLGLRPLLASPLSLTLTTAGQRSPFPGYDSTKYWRVLVGKTPAREPAG